MKFPISNKPFARLALPALAALLLLAACGGRPTPQGPGEPAQPLPTPRVDFGPVVDVGGLTVAMPAGVWSDTYKTAVLDPFTAQTGVGVQVVTDTTDYLSLLQSEAQTDEPRFDVVWLSDVEYFSAGAAGLLARVTYDDIAPADDLYRIARGEFGVSSEIGAWGLVYNADRLDDLPAAWTDLLKPENASLVGLVIPSVRGPEILNLLILARAVGGGPDQATSEGIQQARLLADNGAQLAGYEALGALLAGGDIALAPYASQDAQRLARTGAPTGFFAPPTGAYGFGAWMTIPANLPDERRLAAMQFMSFVLSQNAQAALAAANFSAPANKAVALEPGVAASIYPYGQAQVDELFAPDWPFIVSRSVEWVEKWQRDVQPAG